MKETAIAAKFAEKGIHARTVRLDMALAEYRNNGGTYEEGLARLESAFPDHGSRLSFAGRTLSERAIQLRNDGENGSAPYADKAKLSLPASPSPVAAKGLEVDAGQARIGLPDAAPQRNGAGQSSSAEKAMERVPASVSPRNMPGHAKRGMAAISAVQETVAKSLFDTTRLPDGRSLREVNWSEVPYLASRYAFLSRVMVAIHRRGTPVDPDARLDSLVSEEELKNIIGAVERLNDIH